MLEQVMQAEVYITLDQVAHEFEVWRITLQHKGRIPERLWQSANIVDQELSSQSGRRTASSQLQRIEATIG